MLPILGIIDLFFKPIKIKRWWITSLFSLLWELVCSFTSTLLPEPRERDYVYVGCFMPFLFLIGLGMLCHSRILEKYISGMAASSTVSRLRPFRTIMGVVIGITIVRRYLSASS
jgi:hypothetical protein